MTNGCVATGTNITNFRNSECRGKTIPNIDMPPLQSARASGYRTMPTRCAESPGAIHSMIRSLPVVLQPQTFPIFEIQNAVIREFPTLICSRYSQLWPAHGVLALLNALNLLMPSLSPYDPWLCCYMHKHHQFSEFEMRR